jgi:hypothetical protein
MTGGLAVKRLYIHEKERRSALKLLPLLKLGPSASSARSAGKFFKRVHNNVLRYVSYHFADAPSRRWSLDAVTEIGQLLEV